MPTHYNVKMKMLYALAICGLVRRDDLAIFSETMNAGSHDIMDLIRAGFVKESSAEVDIRIGGRSRKRVRRVCCITNKGLAFLLEFGGALFPWLERIPKSIIGSVNLRGGTLARKAPLDRRLNLAGANCFYAAAGFEVHPLVFGDDEDSQKPALTAIIANAVGDFAPEESTVYYNAIEVKRKCIDADAEDSHSQRFTRQVGFAAYSKNDFSIYVIPQGGMRWKTEIAKKEWRLFYDYRSKIRMHQMKECYAVLLARNPRDFAARFRSIKDFSGRKIKMRRLYVVPMKCEGRKDNSMAVTTGFDREWENCIAKLEEDARFERNTSSFTFPFRTCREGEIYHVALGTVMELYNIHYIKEKADEGMPVVIYCYRHQVPYYRAVFGDDILYDFAD